MLIVMRHGAAEDEIQRVVATIEEMGYQARPMPGKQRTTVGLVGNDGRVDGSRLAALPGVQEIIHVTKPYKQVSREWQAESTVVRLPGGLTVGGDEVVVMAGPCSVESERQILAAAARGPRGRRHRAPGRRLQAAQLALLLPGPGPGRAASCWRGRARRPGCSSSPRRWTPRDWTRSSRWPTSSRSARATCRTTPSSSTPAGAASRSCSSAGSPPRSRSCCSRRSTFWPKATARSSCASAASASFDQATRNLFDLSAIAVVHGLSHLPIVADPSHGTGHRDMVIPMARAAVAAGADGLLVEVHPTPTARCPTARRASTPNSSSG